jgi:hypothetical protein
MVDLPCSLRVTVVVFVAIIVIFFAVAFVFLFVFFLGWLLSKEDIGSYRPIRRVWVGAFWMYSAHVQWYASYCLATVATMGGALRDCKMLCRF